MREINTKFGKLYIDEFTDDRHTGRDESKIKLYDSYEKYMDYFEIETFYELAETNERTPEEELEVYIQSLEECDTIERLLENTITEGYELVKQSWKEVAEHLELAYRRDEARMFQEVINNEWVNIVGDYYIVVFEC